MRALLAPGALVLGVCAVSLEARAQVPVHAWPQAGYDDALFVRQADRLLHGGWLGPYDALTLAKGPGYPLFLALASLAHLRLPVAEQLVQLAAAALLGAGTGRFARSRALGLAVFVVTALDPVYLGLEAARVNRTGLYGSLTTALLGLLLLACTLGPRRGPTRRALAEVLLTGVGTGAVAWACLITREERVALLPLVGLVALAAVLRGRHGRPPGRAGGSRVVLRRLVPAGLALLLAAGTAGAGFVAVEQRNARAYGYAGVTDFADGAFPRLYDSLAAVDVGTARRYVPISRAQRAAAYAASPTMARLAPQLEAAAAAWVGPGCDALHVCDDVAAGWMPWALRQAVFQLLGTPDAHTVQVFLDRAAREVRAGCGSRYPCRTSRVPFLPARSGVSLATLARTSAEGLRVVASFDPPPPLGITPGTRAQQAVFARVLRGVSPDPTAEQRQVDRAAGWRDLTRSAYQAVALLGGALALVGLLWPRDRGQRPVQLAGLAVGLVALWRVVFIALVDVTSFPAVRTGGYLLPACDPAAVAVLLGCWSLATVARQRRLSRRRQVPLRVRPHARGSAEEQAERAEREADHEGEHRVLGAPRLTR